jgi:hypothetical protein
MGMWNICVGSLFRSFFTPDFLEHSIKITPMLAAIISIEWAIFAFG